MPKSVMPFFEPLPYYMSAIGMQGARFIDGNDGSGAGAVGGEKPADDAKPDADIKPDEDKKPDTDFKSDESKATVLADLKKERDDRKRFQGEVTERDTQISTLTESLTEKTNAVTEREATITAKDSEIAVLKLALTHGISDADDLELLGSVADADKRATLAERLGKQAGGSGVVRKSGTGNDGGVGAGGSVAAGKDLYASRKK